MTDLVVHKDAFGLGIVNPAACIINHVSVVSNSNALDDEIDSLMQKLTKEPETILSRAEVQGFKELFARMGYPKQTPAGQRLIESFQQRGFKRYNNLIDAYNISSASFGSGLGMHDAFKITYSAGYGDIHVYRAQGDEKIIPLFKTNLVNVRRGDLVYGAIIHVGNHDYDESNNTAGVDLMAWLGKRDVDSDEFKVTDDTKSLLLIVLGNAATSEDYNRCACLKALDLIRRTCPNATAEFLNIVQRASL